MGLLDKILGRGKKAAGDVTGDASMQREGSVQGDGDAQERESPAEDSAADHEKLAAEQRQQAAEAHVDRENA